MRVELQADCFAGVWAHHSQQGKGWLLEQGDVEEALNAAAQIGDDTLQRKSQGTVRARKLHARHQRAARELVQARHETGSVDALQHLRGARL